MKANMLCVNDNGTRSMGYRKSLESAGVVVPNACDETAVEELDDVQFSFFLQWFDDWKRRACEAAN